MGASLRSKVDDKNKISAWLTLTTKSLASHLDAIRLLKIGFEQLRFDEKAVLLSYYNSVKLAGNHVFPVRVIAMRCKWHHVSIAL